MNIRMAEFLIELATLGVKVSGRDLHFANINPYHQFPDPQYYRDIEFRRYGHAGKPSYYTTEGGGRYTTYPALERNAVAPMVGAMLTHPVGFVIALGITVPLLSHYMAQKYPGQAVPDHAPLHFNDPTPLYLQN